MVQHLLTAYLRRLGFDQPPQPDLQSLKCLQMRHMERIPFENLDVMAGRPITMSTAAVLDKIVTRNRGGFCFEVNEAFYTLLVSLGYTVDRIEGRVWQAGNQVFGDPFDHLALVVHFDDLACLADVGFGDGPREPMPLPESLHTCVAGTFRIRRAPSGPFDLVLEQAKPGQPHFETLYGMTLKTRTASDFAPMCAHLQSSAESIFTQKTICTIATPTGRHTLSGDRFITTTNKHRAETQPSPAERRQLLSAIFALEDEPRAAAEMARFI